MRYVQADVLTQRLRLQHPGNEVDDRVVCVVPAEGRQREARGARRVQRGDEEEDRAEAVRHVVEQADSVQPHEHVLAGLHLHPGMVDVRLSVEAGHVAQRDDDGEEDREDEGSDPNGLVRWH